MRFICISCPNLLHFQPGICYNLAMKRILIISLILITAVIVLTACGSTVPERLVGEWQCADSPSGNAMYTGMYTMTIQEDGSFSIVDTEAGNPCIAGTMKGDDTGKLGILELTCNTDDFDPPICWPNFKPNSSVRYKIIDNDTIKLGYVGIWLTFNK